MHENQSHDEISLKELLLSIWTGKWIIAGLTLFCLILAIVGSLYLSRMNESSELIVTFTFPGIEEHKNPDGTDFNPYQIAKPYVLSNVIDQLDLEGISTNSIRALVEMEPIVPNFVLKEQEFSLEKEGTTKPYFPNAYVLRVNADPSLGIDGELTKDIANQIVYSYLEYFSDEYLYRRPIVDKLIGFNHEEVDYADISMVLHSQLSELKKSNNTLALLDPDFRSKRTGMTFKDINDLVQVIEIVDMNRLDSLISSYKLTKDKEKLIQYYEYLIEQLEHERNIVSGKALVTKELLTEIEDTSSNALDALIGSNGSTSTQYNELVLAVAAGTETSVTIDEQIAYYQREIRDIEDPLTIAGTLESELYQEADLLVIDIIENLKRWIALSNETANEFYDVYMAGVVYPLSPAIQRSGINLMLNSAIGLVLGLMLGIFAALFRSYWHRA